MKRILSLMALMILGAAAVKADEGMWLPSLISQRIGDMQSKGFRLTAEDIYSINQASLKDAVVLFGGGCSAELISSQGLLLTNHHCGYSQIQRHSSVEHDYLRDGFWAMNRSQELPNKGLSVSFLERMEDVTDQVLEGYEKGMDEQKRDALVKKNIRAIREKAVAGSEHLRASVESLFYGNTYYLFVFKRFSDVRLVGAPPSSIGKFGGDTDNWMWPRHTGDFSLFRIYADKNNEPADYSEDNVPYVPKRFFKVSTAGVKEGDFTFVYGFPGRTREYIHSEAVRYTAEVSNPAKIALRTLRLEIQQKYMDMDQATRIKYSSKNAGVANAWKKWQGEMKGLIRLHTVQEKQEYERRFEQWAGGTEYEGLVPRFTSLYQRLEPYMYASEYYRESAATVEIVRFALRMKTLAEDPDCDAGRIRETAEAFYKDYYLPIDKESFVAVMKAFSENLSPAFQPEYFKKELAAYGSVEKWAEDLFSRTVFADRQKVLSMNPADLKAAVAASDPAIAFGANFTEWYEKDIQPTVSEINREINLLYRDYMKGQMEFEPEKEFYPDANSTLRVAYGNIRGYSPADGIYYHPSSSIEGIMEKDNPEIFDYDIPQRLRDLFASKEYGRWESDGSVPVCFIATNHTTGGNSGSPVIDRNGNLIGINFDRVWEGTMSDIVFDPDFCRNISLDIRFVLFTIDKIGGAHHLLEEIEMVD